MRCFIIFSFLLATSCKFNLFSDKPHKEIEVNDLSPIESTLDAFGKGKGPFHKSEAFIGANEFYLVQGYTLASAIGCLADKVPAPLKVDLTGQNIKLADLTNVSNFYVIANGKIVASIKEDTFNLKRILTEIGESTIRKNKSNSFSKSNFTIKSFDGFLNPGECVAKVKEDLVSGTWMFHYKQQFRITNCSTGAERTVHTIREAKIKNLLINKLLPSVKQTNQIIEVWDTFLPPYGNSSGDIKIAYHVKVETNNFTEFIFMAKKGNKIQQIASIKQGDIEQVLGSLPRKLASLPGRNEVWHVKMLPGLPINPFLYIATAVIKTDSDQEELRKAERILNPTSKTSTSCK